MKRTKLWILGAVVLGALTACEDKGGSTPEPEPVETGKYLLAAAFDGATYFLTADDLTDPAVTLTPTGNNGLEVNGTYTHYVPNGTKGLLALRYGQGGTHVGAGFTIGSNGRAVQVGTDFEIPSGFTTAGSVGHYVVTARSGQTLTGGSKGAVVNFIDLNNNNSLVSKSVNTEKFPGLEGKTISLLGIADAGNDEFFTGLEITGGSADSVYVAKLDINLNVKQIYKDNRLSRSGGQFRSARYSQIGNDEDGNTYVFSGAYGTVTTKTCGALVIRKGAAGFDPSYHFDIEAKSDGYRFRKVWHIQEDYFLLEFYNEKGSGGAVSDASQYAVVKMSTKDFKWIKGLPAKEEISAMKTPFSYNGKMFIGVATVSEKPAVYILDPATAVAVRGATVSDVTSIEGIAFIKD